MSLDNGWSWSSFISFYCIHETAWSFCVNPCHLLRIISWLLFLFVLLIRHSFPTVLASLSWFDGITSNLFLYRIEFFNNDKLVEIVNTSDMNLKGCLQRGLEEGHAPVVRHAAIRLEKARRINRYDMGLARLLLLFYEGLPFRLKEMRMDKVQQVLRAQSGRHWIVK